MIQGNNQNDTAVQIRETTFFFKKNMLNSSLRMFCFTAHEEISKITGSSVKLRVTYKLQITGNVKWTKESSTLRGDRHTLAQDNSLIITDIRKPDEGVYTATDSKNRVVAQYTLKVDISKYPTFALNFL